MLQRMGWSSGKGLGRHEDGMATHIRVKRRDDTMGAWCAVA
jgi:Pin2-interacting protein X1